MIRSDCPSYAPPCGYCDACAQTEVAESRRNRRAKDAYDEEVRRLVEERKLTFHWIGYD